MLSFPFSPAAVAQETNSVARPVAEPLEPDVVSPLEERLIQAGLVDVRLLDTSIRVDLKYARADNFMGASAYGELARAYLHPEAARKLAKASRILQERYPHLRILVLDAARPRSVQHKMWKIVAGTAMQPYVANPHSGSMHNFGAAVDVTLYDMETQARLDMGTAIDFFGPLAQPSLEVKFLQEGKLSEQHIQNRLIMRTAMRDAGWHVLTIEWWHFDAFPRDYTRRKYSMID
ncbi:MAG: peptidase M15D vanX D-ala-D-ala dipeptidase [Desulfobacteraceae bacterium]|nr:MAG: peptidase M15D vanX D-ala-D-ala dipeptidase [Desulfobacteraceae bacterium]